MKYVFLILFSCYSSFHCLVNFSRRELNQFNILCLENLVASNYQHFARSSNDENNLIVIPKFTKRKLTNQLTENIFLNVSFLSTNNKNLYAVDIQIGKKKVCNVVDIFNLSSVYNSELNFSNYEFMLKKHDTERNLLLKILELSAGNKKIFFTTVPSIDEIDNPDVYKVVIFIEISTWKENSIQVMFDSPLRSRVDYFVVRVLDKNNEILNENVIKSNHQRLTNQIIFNNLQPNTDYYVTVDPICRRCQKSQSQLFRLPALEFERDPFNHIHTVVISCCIAFLLLAFASALILSKRRLLIQKQRNVLVLYDGNEPYELPSFVNLLQQYHFRVTVNRLKMLNEKNVELEKRILSFQFVVLIWHNTNCTEKYNNAILFLIAKHKLINTLWYDTHISHIPIEFRQFLTFGLPNESHKLLHYLNSKKLSYSKNLYMSICSEKTDFSDCEYYVGLISPDDEFIEDQHENEVLPTINQDLMVNQMSNCKQITLPVVVDISFSGLDSSSSSVVLHAN